MRHTPCGYCVRPHDDHYTHDSHPHPALRATFPLGGGRLGIVSLRGAKRRGDPSPKIVLTKLVYSDKLQSEDRFITINSKEAIPWKSCLMGNTS